MKENAYYSKIASTEGDISEREFWSIIDVVSSTPLGNDLQTGYNGETSTR